MSFVKASFRTSDDGRSKTPPLGLMATWDKLIDSIAIPSDQAHGKTVPILRATEASPGIFRLVSTCRPRSRGTDIG